MRNFVDFAKPLSTTLLNFLGFSVDSANVKQYVLSFSPRPLLYLNTT